MTEQAAPGSVVEAVSAQVRTFLIADVRGYTAFTNEQGDEAAARLANRFAISTKGVVEERDGEVLELRGDEALVVFQSPRQALRAALELQDRFRQEMEAHPDLPLKVGMGIDAGEAIPVQGGYRGGALNLAARLCSIAGAGEVFCSETVIGLARKTDGITLVDRGEVTLKGLTDPVRVIQIGAEGELPSQLPPLQPILVIHPNNLPDDPTPFIGREQEIERIAGLFRDPHIRLVTLTGPGGTGKTRLALQVGNTLLYDFKDGVFFVSLASLADPSLVCVAIAEVLGLKEEGGKPLLQTLTQHLSDKHLLLVVDNFEHLLDACQTVADLLDGCREVHIMVTSRIPLHLSREHEHAVPPLSVPDLQHLPDLGALSQYESVALFIERARAVKDTFNVTNDNAPAIAEICSRLDGLPLAIELAAARIKLFPPQALLQRLSSRLKLLTGGARDQPSRQQTLRGAIDWSYSLLTNPEQILLARLSVFAGGCSFEAAEAVCNSEGDLDLLEQLAALVDKNLLREEGEEEPRFAMLETIREYAAERLEATDQAEEVRERCAAYYLGLAEEAEPELMGAQQTLWLNRLEMEHDNLRAALGWVLAEQRAEEGLRLAGALYRFWSIRGHFSEGRRWLERVLAIGGEASPAVRAKALFGAGDLSSQQGDYERATTLCQESLTLWRELGDSRGIGSSLNTLGLVAWLHGDCKGATTLFDESLALRRELGDIRGIAMSLNNLGCVAWSQGDHEQAAILHDESLTLARELGNTESIGFSLNNLGLVALAQGDYERATTLFDQGLTLARELRYTRGIAFSLNNLGLVAVAQGNYGRAATLSDQALVLARELRDSETAIECVETLASVAAACHVPQRAARLWGAADAWREANNVPLSPVLRQQHERMVAQARQQLDEPAWTAAWEEGQAMTVEQVIGYALGESTPQTPGTRESITVT